MSAHPILEDLSRQLPRTATTCRYINEPRSFEEIAAQARKEFFSLGSPDGFIEEGISGKTFLDQNGYDMWLKEGDEEERTRGLGVLKLIMELAEDLDGE